MPSQPSLSEILLTAALSLPGALIMLGLVIGLAVLIVPLFLPETHGWRAVERRVVISDWGFSLSAVMIAIGLLLVDFKYGTSLSFGYGGRFQYGLSGLLFLFAGRRVYSRCIS